MKSFAERNLVAIGVAGVAVTATVVLGAMNYERLPFFDQGADYQAYFSEASGLASGAAVQVAGFKVGQVASVELDGPKVLVRFDVARNIRLGNLTEAAVKTKSLLGAKILEITPRGDGQQDGPIPVARTRPAYELADALGDLSTTIESLDTQQLSDSLATVAETFKDTPPDLQIAMEGLTRFSQSLGRRDVELRNLLTNAEKSTTVLAERSGEIVQLVSQSNALLEQLLQRGESLDQLSSNISFLARELSGVIADNREQLAPALDKLNAVLTLVDNRKERVQEAIKRLNDYAMSLGESVGSGPFFKAYVANLLPGQFIQPFVDAAFSDLGLDPAVLLPSQLTDPQTGQAATPALPVPYPRTGQGGEPALTLPEAITGSPGDQRYPYREPPPAPPAGGPPPGPPADLRPPPQPSDVYDHDPLSPSAAGEAGQ